MKSDFVICVECGWPYASVDDCVLEIQHGTLRDQLTDNCGDAESIAKASN